MVPFPIGKPELIRYYIPDDTRIFVTILDAWGYCKNERLKDFGYEVEVLWEKTEKLISSSMIRRRIMEEKSWNEFVPDATYRFVVEQGIDQRIRHTAENH